MALGRRKGERQHELWVETESLPSSPGHPFYERLNAVLGARGFDAYVEQACAPFYAEKMGCPSLAPGVYFRMLLVGYFERIDSERGIAWRCSDSLALRDFLSCGIEECPPDHSTVSRTRRLIDVETHEAVFGWVLRVLGESGLVRGKTIGIDATTLEANAALRSIIRRETGESYEEFLEGLAKASGIETPTRQDLVKLDRKRKKKVSNDDWRHPHDPDAQIAKMKDGRTHVAHKDEHAVDLDTGAILAVTLHGGAVGDTSSVLQTLAAVEKSIETLREDDVVEEHLSKDVLAEVVLDKGYHSNDTLVALQEGEYRTYVSEPERGRRNWEGKEKEKRAVYANRRRIRGKRGKRLLRLRGELLERPFAHYLDGGGMRRTHLRQHESILKRLLIHVAGFNLALLMRKLVGCGTPRGHRGGITAPSLALLFPFCDVRTHLGRLCGRVRPIWYLPSRQRHSVTQLAYAA
jgi:transposase